jgi:hypothetical protein
MTFDLFILVVAFAASAATAIAGLSTKGISHTNLLIPISICIAIAALFFALQFDLPGVEAYVE